MIRHAAELWLGFALVFLTGCLIGSLVERTIAQTRAGRLQRRCVLGLLRIGRGILWRLFPWRGQAPEVPVSVAIPAPAYGTAVNQIGGLVPHDLPPGPPSDEEEEGEPGVGPPRRPSAATERRRAESLARAEASGGHRPMALAAPRGGKADALIAIDGVSRREARWLGEIGIYHYGQIAAWTPVELTWVAAYLGRTEPVDELAWVASATALATGASPPKRRPKPRPAGGDAREIVEPLNTEDAPAVAPDDGPAEARAIDATPAAMVPLQTTDGSAAVGPPPERGASVAPPPPAAEPAEAAAPADTDDAGLEPRAPAAIPAAAEPDEAAVPPAASPIEAATAHAEPPAIGTLPPAESGSAEPEAAAGDTELGVGDDAPSESGGAGDASGEAAAALFEIAPPEGATRNDPPEHRSVALAVPPASERPDEAEEAPLRAASAGDIPAEEAQATDGRVAGTAGDAAEKPEGESAPLSSGDGALVQPEEKTRDRRDESAP